MPNTSLSFPAYIQRKDTENNIKEIIKTVRSDKLSRVAWLHGNGGVGKSFFINHLSIRIKNKNALFIKPFDMDDSEFWLFTNLEQKVMEVFNAEESFQEYLEYKSRLPEHVTSQLGHETVLAYLRKGEEIFQKCYNEHVKSLSITPVIIFDTLEAIRGTDTLISLVRWMKKLRGTVFILAGRPMLPKKKMEDPVLREIAEQFKTYEDIPLRGFSIVEARRYLSSNNVTKKLDDLEIEKIAFLTGGHPLWLAMTIYYLSKQSLPESLRQLNIDRIKTLSSKKLARLRNEFISKLILPFRERDFFHEAVLRLGVIRRRVDFNIWQQMMDGCPLPVELSWEECWQQLLRSPWIRKRSDENYITLQDALAEELAGRIIPAFDKNKDWRENRWKQSAELYDNLLKEKKGAWEKNAEEFESKCAQNRKASNIKKYSASMIKGVIELENDRNKIYLLETTWLYYLMLSDFKGACARFVELFKSAMQHHNYHFVDLLWVEMQRFLPHGSAYDPLEDIIKPVIQQFHEWYLKEPHIQFEIICNIAQYLIDVGRPAEAEEKLDKLWKICKGAPNKEYRILNLRANARLRLAYGNKRSEADFRRALSIVQNNSKLSKNKELLSNALTELGYFYRSVGDRLKAADMYLQALKICPIRALKERAAIQAQFAYVEALRGRYQDAKDLIEPALNVRRSLKLLREIAMAYSVKGEVHRYAREYPEAWRALEEAELGFERINDKSWLSLVYQEKAICLYQAANASVQLPNYSISQTMVTDAKRLILKSLEFGEEYNHRALPSAYNRAGRIIGFGSKDAYDLGLQYLENGIIKSREVYDGWMQFANLVEYVDLCYWAWQNTGDESYRKLISDKKDEIIEISNTFQSGFQDLKGRFELLQGLLHTHDGLTTTNVKDKKQKFNSALEHFKKGYPLIAERYSGSHGAVMLPTVFNSLGELICKLPLDVAHDWVIKLEECWSSEKSEYIKNEKIQISLLGLLTSIYSNLKKPFEGGANDSI